MMSLEHQIQLYPRHEPANEGATVILDEARAKYRQAQALLQKEGVQKHEGAQESLSF
jgi:hypothetical protein